MNFLLAPSILSADLFCLGEQVAILEQVEVDWIHADVMDGHHVANLSFGSFLLPVIKQQIHLTIEANFMIANPENFLLAFLAGDADIVTIHVESCSHLFHTLQTICAAGCKAGAALNPVIPVETLREVMHLLNVVLIMGNNPGISGQGWFPEMAAQISRLARFWEQRGVPAIIQVDGGMNAQALPEAYHTGAGVFMSGSAIFKHSEGLASGIQSLRQSVRHVLG